jgi:hypothetical protein
MLFACSGTAAEVLSSVHQHTLLSIAHASLGRHALRASAPGLLLGEITSGKHNTLRVRLAAQ